VSAWTGGKERLDSGFGMKGSRRNFLFILVDELQGDWIKCSCKSLRREVNTSVILLNEERTDVIISEVQEMSVGKAQL